MASELLPETLPVHIDSLRRAARGMTRTRQDAEDLVQDTLLKVLARPRRSARPAPARTCTRRCATRTSPPCAPVTAARCSPRSSPRTPAWSPPPRVSRWRSCTRREVSTRSTAAAAQREVIAAVDVAGLGYTEAAEPADPGRHRHEPPAPRPRAPRTTLSRCAALSEGPAGTPSATSA